MSIPLQLQQSSFKPRNSDRNLNTYNAPIAVLQSRRMSNIKRQQKLISSLVSFAFAAVI